MRERKQYAKPVELKDFEKMYDTMLKDMQGVYDELDKADELNEKYKKQVTDNFNAWQSAVKQPVKEVEDKEEITLDDIARGGKLSE